ncbi:MAG: methyltransferase [Microbacteriaceae bacterium]
MSSEHYFTVSPESSPNFRPFEVSLNGVHYQLTTASGIFSPERVDQGTQVLLANSPATPPSGNLLDLGCGWGPVALTLALQSPNSTVWAVDVNERALELVRMNASKLGLQNVNACLPDEVPADIEFRAIRSNPPIRVGKDELHNLLSRWLVRLQEGSEAHLVVQKNLGADSLQRWMDSTLGEDYSVVRTTTSKGFRILRVRRKG